MGIVHRCRVPRSRTEGSPRLAFILFTEKGSEAVVSEVVVPSMTYSLQKESGTSQYTVLANRIANTVAQHWAA